MNQLFEFVILVTGNAMIKTSSMFPVLAILWLLMQGKKEM
ncbi:hypothetical protein PC116_g6885 [Phytophthora cactorum]|nr:hypothetical protein PC116_g6885 [Phytophthora cactorum]